MLYTTLCLFTLLQGPGAPDVPTQQDQQPQHSAVQPAQRDGWAHERFLAMNERVGQGDIDLVFLGDSITQGWEGAGKAVWQGHYGKHMAVNLGVSGDRTQHVLWRLNNGNVDGIAPQVVVVMIGTNNSNGDDNTVAEIADGVRAIVGTLREKLPGAKILLLDIFPRGEVPNPQRGKICQVNQLLEKLHDGEHVYFLSIGHHFVDDEGRISTEIMPDHLHLSERGYRIWAEAIGPTLSKLLGE